MPSKLSYTNRQNSTAYIRAVPGKRGGLRYYITKDPRAQDLIEEMPEGFEFYEYIHDARIVFRKRKTSQILPAERQIVEDAVANLSAATDFIVEAQDKEIVVFISQFNSIMGQEENLTADEAREAWGENSDRWKKYYDYVKFVLVSKKNACSWGPAWYLWATSTTITSSWHGRKIWNSWPKKSANTSGAIPILICCRKGSSGMRRNSVSRDCLTSSQPPYPYPFYPLKSRNHRVQQRLPDLNYETAILPKFGIGRFQAVKFQ